MQSDRPIPQPGERYRHFKGGIYEVICVTTAGRCIYQRSPRYFTCIHTETGVWYDVMPAEGDPYALPGDTRSWLWPEIDEACVVYRAVRSGCDGKVRARPLDNFLEVLGRPGEGSTRWYRFQKIVNIEEGEIGVVQSSAKI